MLKPQAALRIVKLVHTVVWAILVGVILAIPVYAWLERWTAVAWLIGLMLAECVVLVANGMRCPLTDVAARFTDERQENFDIYLPLWLATHNKTIFGWLFAGTLVFALVRWLT